MTAVCPIPRSPAVGAPWREPPHIWEPKGLSAREQELKVEVTCQTERVEATVAAIRAVHPYEEPVINVIPLYQVGL